MVASGEAIFLTIERRCNQSFEIENRQAVFEAPTNLNQAQSVN
jgi:hypothetical protein